MARRSRPPPFDPDVEELISYQERYFLTILETTDFLLEAAARQRRTLRAQDAKVSAYVKSFDVLNHERDEEITAVSRRLEKSGQDIDELLQLTEITLTGIKRKLSEAEWTMLYLKQHSPREPLSIRCTSNKFLKETSRIRDEINAISDPDEVDEALGKREALFQQLLAAVNRVKARGGHHTLAVPAINIQTSPRSQLSSSLQNTTPGAKPRMQWETDWTITSEGGALCKPYSDVMLIVPPDAVQSGSKMQMRVSVSADSEGIGRFLGLTETERVVSPLVEFAPLSESQQFKRPVLVTLPHSLPADYDPNLVRVVSAKRLGETYVLSSVPIRNSNHGFPAKDSTPPAKKKVGFESQADVKAFDPDEDSDSLEMYDDAGSLDTQVTEPELKDLMESDTDSATKAAGAYLQELAAKKKERKEKDAKEKYGIYKEKVRTLNDEKEEIDEKCKETAGDRRQEREVGEGREFARITDGVVEIQTMRPSTYGVAMRQDKDVTSTLTLVACGSNDAMPDGNQAAQVTVYAWDERLSIRDFQAEYGIDWSRRLDNTTVTLTQDPGVKCHNDVHVLAKFDAVGNNAKAWRHCQGADGNSALPDVQKRALSKMLSCDPSSCPLAGHHRPKTSPAKFEWMLETFRQPTARKSSRTGQEKQSLWLRCVISIADVIKGKSPDWSDDDVILGRLKLTLHDSNHPGNQTSRATANDLDPQEEEFYTNKSRVWHKRFISGTVFTTLGRRLGGEWRRFIRLLPGWESDSLTTADMAIRAATTTRRRKESEQIEQSLGTWMSACPSRVTRANILRALSLYGEGGKEIGEELDRLHAGQIPVKGKTD